ncbi:unnamed protein product, partial [Calicophoron daubneyi]
MHSFLCPEGDRKYLQPVINPVKIMWDLGANSQSKQTANNGNVSSTHELDDAAAFRGASKAPATCGLYAVNFQSKEPTNGVVSKEDPVTSGVLIHLGLSILSLPAYYGQIVNVARIKVTGLYILLTGLLLLIVCVTGLIGLWLKHSGLLSLFLGLLLVTASWEVGAVRLDFSNLYT